MTTVSTEEAGLPFANRASFRLARTESGMWLADDPEIECYAEGNSPNEAITELLKAERDYLEILRAERSLSPLAQAHLTALSTRLSLTS